MKNSSNVEIYNAIHNYLSYDEMVRVELFDDMIETLEDGLPTDEGRWTVGMYDGEAVQVVCEKVRHMKGFFMALKNFQEVTVVILNDCGDVVDRFVFVGYDWGADGREGSRVVDLVEAVVAGEYEDFFEFCDDLMFGFIPMVSPWQGLTGEGQLLLKKVNNVNVAGELFEGYMEEIGWDPKAYQEELAYA